MAVSDNTSTQKESPQDDPHKALRRAVIGMGVLLACGFILLLVFAMLGISPKEALRQERQEQQPTTALDACGSHEIELGAGEAVQSLWTEGALLSLRTTLPEGSVVLRQVDICTGQALGQVKIVNNQ